MELTNQLTKGNKITPPHQPTIAVDLDGTLDECTGPCNLQTSRPRPGAVESMQRLHDRGVKLIAWTARDDYPAIREWLDKWGIPYDDLNHNDDQVTSSRKLEADLYVDDRTISGKQEWPDIERRVISRLGKHCRQPVDEDAGYEVMRELAETVRPQFDQFLGSLDLLIVPVELSAGYLHQPGPVVVMADIKEEPRSTSKVEGDYNGDWRRLLDVVRASVACDNWTQLQQYLKQLQQAVPLAKPLKNRFAKPLRNGYRDILCNFKLPPTNFVVEVQFHLKPMLIAREQEKLGYDVVRTIKVAMAEEGRDELTGAERAAIKKVRAHSRAIYTTAWRQCQQNDPTLPARVEKQMDLVDDLDKDWVTLSPSGTHVFLEGGKVTAGPAALTSKPVDQLSPKKPKRKPAGGKKPPGKPTEATPSSTSHGLAKQTPEGVHEAFSKLTPVDEDGRPADHHTGEVGTDNFFRAAPKGDRTYALMTTDYLAEDNGFGNDQEGFVNKFGTRQSVKISDLASTQPTIEEDKVAALMTPEGKARMAKSDESDLPVVVRVGGSLYAWDGQHRIVGHSLLGKDSTDVMLIDIDAIRGKKGVHWSIKKQCSDLVSALDDVEKFNCCRSAPQSVLKDMCGGKDRGGRNFCMEDGKRTRCPKTGTGGLKPCGEKPGGDKKPGDKKKPGKPTVEQTLEVLKKAAVEGVTEESVKALTSHTVADLKQIQAALGINRATGVKAERVQSITRQVMDMARQSKQRQVQQQQQATKPKKPETQAQEQPTQPKKQATFKRGQPLTRADLVEKFKGLKGKELVSAIGKMMSEAGTVKGPIAAHGMAKPEQMAGITIDGMEILWPNKRPPMENGDVREAVAHMLDNVPNNLREATKRVVFSNQANKDDGHWEKTYNIKNFRSGATGGDGSIVVYNQPMGQGMFSHESGHNLASALWGGTTRPPADSDYGKAQAAEGPVSAYGASSPDEDFAEACRMYTDDGPYGKKKLAAEFPKKYAALEQLLNKPLPKKTELEDLLSGLD